MLVFLYIFYIKDKRKLSCGIVFTNTGFFMILECKLFTYVKPEK
jgi:hypothetical protein